MQKPIWHCQWRFFFVSKHNDPYSSEILFLYVETLATPGKSRGGAKVHCRPQKQGDGVSSAIRLWLIIVFVKCSNQIIRFIFIPFFCIWTLSEIQFKKKTFEYVSFLVFLRFIWIIMQSSIVFIIHYKTSYR